MKINMPAKQICSKHILVKFIDEEKKDFIKSSAKSKLSLKTLELSKSLRYSRSELLKLHPDDDMERAIYHLHNHPDIHYAQPDLLLSACDAPDNDNFKYQWPLRNTGQANKLNITGISGMDIDADAAWNITRGSPSVIVAVIDTGIDIRHNDLKDNIYVNSCEIPKNQKDDDGNNYRDDVCGWDFVHKDNIVFDSQTDDKHGTLIAGIIAAKGSGSGVIGVAPNIRILPLKIMESKSGNTSSAIEAIEYAKSKGIRLANCSWGDSNHNPALKYHMENSNILFVCAAGNKGISLDDEHAFYPACFDIPNVLSVAAVNNKGILWDLSNFGKGVHVAAPGTCIYSTIPSQYESCYGTDTGTSLATPHVTGIAALVMSEYPHLDVSEVKQRILSSVKLLGGLKDKVSSGGMVNAYSALTLK